MTREDRYVKRIEQIDRLEDALVAIAQVRDQTSDGVAGHLLAEIHDELYEVRDHIRDSVDRDRSLYPARSL